MKIPTSEHVVYTNCFLFWYSEQFMYTTCSELVIFMYWTCSSINNLLSYCGLVDGRISASEKDLPVPKYVFQQQQQNFQKLNDWKLISIFKSQI